MKTSRTLIVLLALLVIGVAAYAGKRWLLSSLDAPGPHGSVVSLRVAPGAGLRAALTDLAASGAIRDARQVMLALRAQGISPTIHAGRYEIAPHASPREIIAQLVAGRVVLVSLTIPEGSRFADLRRALEQHPAVEQTLRGRSDEEVMAVLGHAGEHPEGRFFPDTYRFAEGSSDREILQLAYRQMERLLASGWASRAKDLPLRTPYDALILASIIEKETGLASERPRIGGVFVSRLRKGMRLQTDPTVIYGLGAAYDGNIRTRDLQTDTPYNTYTRDGLTPTPIALPGREALQAALHPVEDGSLFFVASGAGDGSHIFTADYAAHQAAVRSMLQGQRRRGVIP